MPARFNPEGQAYVDLGDGPVVGNDFYDGRFKMPSLRNVALTAPYMHNGFFNELEQVVEFYNTRNTAGLWPAPEVNKNVIMNPPGRPDVALGQIGLTDAEIDDIVAFLQTLSDNR
jgi:cytochrome c peroxidase